MLKLTVLSSEEENNSDTTAIHHRAHSSISAERAAQSF